MKAFRKHMMYDPKTGKGYKAEKPADHDRMKKKGYTHTAPKKKKQYLLIMHKQADKKPKVFKTLESLSILLEKKKTKPKEKKEGL